MAATGKTPILLYGSATATNAPSAGNLTNNSDGCEIAINVADKNLFFKDSTNTVNTVPIRQSSASSNGWLSTTDWSTFNNKAGTSSPTFSGDVTLSTGNLVIGTSGKGIAGTTTNDNADAGVVGEFVSSYVSSLVAMTSGTAKNVTSISLTAGDWDVTGCIGFLPASTTSVTALAGTIFTTSATYQDNAQYSFQDYYSSIIPGGSTTFYKTLPTVRLSLASTTTVYLIARASFSVSALYHGNSFIRARRVR